MPEIVFKGKEYVYNHHLTVPYRPLIADAARGIGPEDLNSNLIIHGDNLHALKALLPRYAGAVDLVFIDPPFDGPWFEPALKAAVRAVPVGGWIYLEAPQAWTPEALQPLGLQCERHLKAGAVHAHLLQRTA